MKTSLVKLADSLRELGQDEQRKSKFKELPIPPQTCKARRGVKMKCAQSVKC